MMYIFVLFTYLMKTVELEVLTQGKNIVFTPNPCKA